MFKNILKSKRTKFAALLSVVAVLALSAGLTYAWFNTTVKAEVSDVSMGRFDIKANYDVDDEQYLYEPGLSKKVTGKVSNNGLPFIAKIDLKSAVTITSDADGNALHGSNYYQIDNVDGIEAKMDETLIGFKEGENDAMMSWATGPDGAYYLFVDGKMDVDVAFDVLFSEELGNAFQGAIIKLSGDWTVTQSLEGAMQAQFGIGYDDLDWSSNDLASTSPYSLRSYSNIHDRIREVFFR